MATWLSECVAMHDEMKQRNAVLHHLTQLGACTCDAAVPRCAFDTMTTWLQGELHHPAAPPLPATRLKAATTPTPAQPAAARSQPRSESCQPPAAGRHGQGQSGRQGQAFRQG